MAQTVGFWILAIIAVVAAIMVVANRNPVRCALFLIVNFVCLAIYYLILGAQLLAALQVLVYAGAIMVLFLFVIMLLNLGGEEVEHDPLVAQRPLGALFGVGLLALLGLSLSGTPALHLALPQAAEVGTGPLADPVFQIGQKLFTQYVYPFEVTSLLLLVGIIGTILLAKRKIGDAPSLRERPPGVGVLHSSAESQDLPVGAER